MNPVHEAIQQRLDSESSSTSRGFFSPFPAKQILLNGGADAPTLHVTMGPELSVEPLTDVDTLMKQARLRHR